jgi:AmmeMemoRadiSam system protein A
MKMVENNFSKEKGQLLVRLARAAIGNRLDADVRDMEPTPADLDAPEFQEHRATFVTLHKNGELRGCIGSLSAVEPLAESVRHNAGLAAFRDPRFKPLSKEELDQVDIEVSILTEPSPLDYRDAKDLISKLRPKVDGIILRKGHHSATFLPQVWDQLPNSADFLSHLCRKAGLPADEWQRSHLEISTYQVEYFEEKS